MRLRRALEEFVVEGMKTTIPLHQKLVRDPEFLAGDYTIKWLEASLKGSRRTRLAAYRLQIDPDAVPPVAMLVPAVPVPIAAALVIMALDPAHLGSAVRAACAVTPSMEALSATFAGLGRRSGDARDDGCRGKGNEGFHDWNLLAPRLGNAIP